MNTEWNYSITHEEYLKNKRYIVDESNSSGPKYEICYINSSSTDQAILGFESRSVND